MPRGVPGARIGFVSDLGRMSRRRRLRRVLAVPALAASGKGAKNPYRRILEEAPAPFHGEDGLDADESACRDHDSSRRPARDEPHGA